MVREARRTGRPRDRRVDEAITAATRELLAEVGYARLTVAAVAARAGTGKAAIYRRYATKQEMVHAAAIHRADLTAPPDTGSLLGDLSALAEMIAASLADPVGSAVTLRLLLDCLSDPELAAQPESRFVTAQRTVLAEILDRAARRGECDDPPDLDLLHAALNGTSVAWLFIAGNDPRELAVPLARFAHAALERR